MAQNTEKTISCPETRGDVTGHSFSYTSFSKRCNTKNFVERLKKRRDELSYSQAKLGKLVGVSTTSIQRYEGGQIPNGEHLFALAYALDCSIDWLLGIKDEPETLPQEPTQKPETRDEEPPSISELLTKTAEVLESGTVYSKALSANIQAFHHATKTEKELNEIKIHIEKRFLGLEQQIQELRERNEELERQLMEKKGGSGGVATGRG